MASRNQGAEQADVLLCGGGLANGLIALRLKAARPELRVVLLERDAAPRLDQVWSCFDSDVPTDALAWLKPLQAAWWPSYSVRFPALERRIKTPYGSMTPTSLYTVVEAALGADLVRGADIARITPERATLADGRVFAAPLVIDGRGAAPTGRLSLAWQKFVGLHLRLEQPHGLSEPIVMDATVPQVDGYRFLYTLPFSGDRLLVEDTRYSDGPALDLEALEREALAYAAARGWTVAELERREHGVLPLALGGDIEGFWGDADDGVPRSGMRGALFHPVTGYSLPDAARLADEIAAAPEQTSPAIAALVKARSLSAWRRRGFLRALNRMLFLAAEPHERWRVLKRFHKLPRPLIERFYAAELTLADKARILAGKPPVSVRRAILALGARPVAESAAYA